MPTIHKIFATTALCLAAVDVNSCQQTKKVAPDITGSFLTYTQYPLATEPPAVYRLNEAESRELAKLEALIHPDTPYLDLLPASAQPTFIIFPANGEAKQLDFYLYTVSIPQLSAKVKALVDKIKSRPGAQLQGEELRNWKEAQNTICKTRIPPCSPFFPPSATKIQETRNKMPAASVYLLENLRFL